MKFLLFARVCSEYLGVVSHLSKVLQYDDITIDGVVKKLKATIDRLHEMEKTVADKVLQLVRDLGEELTYKGKQLKLPRGSNREQVIDGITKLAKDLISGTITALKSRLSFTSDPILSAASVFSPSTWPSDSSALARFGYSEIQLLAKHFETSLKTRHYEPAACINEWAELKLRIQELLQLNPRQKYLALWQRILHEFEGNPNLTNILALMRIVFVIPVQTASLERGFSLMERVKNDWRSRLQPTTVTELMSIKLNGPTLKNFNPCPAIGHWWKAGKRRRRTTVLPHGPHRSRAKSSSNVSDTHDSSESDSNESDHLDSSSDDETV